MPQPDLLDPGFVARLGRLQLGTRRPLSGHLSGDHRSRRHGSSLDFADYRDYHPGDDFRRIDYNLMARLDIVAIKLFEADDDLHVRLLVDTSASMASGDKLLQARRIAAALGYVALVRRDSVSVHTIGSGSSGLIAPRFRGPSAAAGLFSHLGSLTAGGPTPFVAAAADLLSRPGPAGLTIVISDLLTPEWTEAIGRLPARGADLIVVHVLGRDEVDPDEVGDFDLVDAETGSRVPVSLSETTLNAYREIVTGWLDEVAGRCRSVGAGYVRVLADEDIEPLILGAWRDAGVLR